MANKKLTKGNKVAFMVQSFVGLPFRGTSSKGTPFTINFVKVVNAQGSGVIGLFAEKADIIELLGSEQTFEYVEKRTSSTGTEYPSFRLATEDWVGYTFE